ncbi:MAG: NAD(P)/FAD-dependent oxidoreductase [Bacteriovoracaceae bacterium]|nr:NAD(P)/FAD-dependent oxidoreductase [Bacteriovoracaceae bacterium]
MKYDAIVIGAGMSGLAAGIRMAMFGKKVCVLEKHTIAGGLNSYYQRRIKETKEIAQFDVGLHALTNFATKGERRKPLTKMLKQLRIGYDEFELCPQSYSLIDFPGKQLRFNNDFELLKNEVYEKFPSEIDSFNKLVEKINNYNELDLNATYISSREVLNSILHNSLLVEMLLAPLLIYGSAWEKDMDFNQFVIMFKSIYMEGFSRPKGGVRTIIDKLIARFKEEGGELKFRCGVEEILLKDNKAIGVRTTKGEELFAPRVFSSAGLPETMELAKKEVNAAVGKMTFMEAIALTERKPTKSEFDATIVFHNSLEQYHYEGAKDFFDSRSAVVCCPDNYEMDNRDGHGCFRVTFMANYEKFKALDRSAYLEKKEEAFEQAMGIVKKLAPQYEFRTVLKDIFTPTTVERYTWKKHGTVYGSPDKIRNGKTDVDGLYIIGTDQGFLGIVGAILSGISLGNLYGLMESE